MRLFREDLAEQPLSRFRAKQLLLELALGELDSVRKSQVEHWITSCKETEADWLALNKALVWCQQTEQNLVLTDAVEAQEPLIKRKSYKVILSAVLLLSALGAGAYYVHQFYDFNASKFQLLAKRDQIRSHLEAMQIEVATTEANINLIGPLLNQFKKEGTEVKSTPGQQANEKIWSAFVPQSHVHELIAQIKTLGLVRIPEGDSAELVSDGQIQIILRSKTP